MVQTGTKFGTFQICDLKPIQVPQRPALEPSRCWHFVNTLRRSFFPARLLHCFRTAQRKPPAMAQKINCKMIRGNLHYSPQRVCFILDCSPRCILSVLRAIHCKHNLHQSSSIMNRYFNSQSKSLKISGKTWYMMVHRGFLKWRNPKMDGL